MSKWLISFVLTLCAIIQLAAQPPLLRHYTLRDGLPSNVIYDVFQDSRGFIWFCTDQGVSRFDGTVFRNYTIEDGLPDNEVFRIREDAQHRYWLICYNRAACYLLNDKVYSSANDDLCRRVEQLGIRYDEMFQSLDGSYCLIGEKIGILSAAPPYIRLWPGVSLLPHRIFYFRKGGQEYIASRLECRNLTTGQVYSLGKSVFSVACYDSSSNCLFLSRAHDLTGTRETLEQWTVGPHCVRKQSAVRLTAVTHQLIMDKPGRLVCCTENGIVVYSPATGKLEYDTVFPRNTRCNRLLTDREGNQWLITLNDGVYFRSKNNYGLISVQSGLSRNNILSLHFSSDGALLAGDERGCINLINPDGIQKLWLNPSELNNRVLFIRDIKDHTLIAGSDHGLYRVGRDGRGALMVPHVSVKSGVNDKAQFFVGSSRGLGIFDMLTGRQTIIMERRVVAMEKDRRGIIWVATTQGVMYYKGKKLYSYDCDATLNQSRVTCMVQDAAGQVLMGTSTKGLFLVTDPLQRPLHLQQHNGLSSNNCRKLFCGMDGIVWLCSGKGVDRLEPGPSGSYKIIPFPLPDIVSGNKINDLVEKDGKLYLATAEGIVVLDSRNAGMVEPPQLFIEAVNGGSLSADKPDSLFAFAFRDRDIQVSYIALSFSGVSKQQYRYLLKGGTEDTLYTDARSLNFSAFSPGGYELLLWARNQGGMWTTAPARLRFVIYPPFWRHPLFLCIAGLMLLTGAALFYRVRLQAVQRRAGQEIRNRQQLARLEMKALRAQINPHFIFNALNSIQAYYSQNDELSANHYMTSFARFIRLTLVHAQAHWLPLGIETDMLRTYIELEQMRFKDLFTFTIVSGSEIDPESVSVPAMLIQPYVENAINHGLRHLKSRKGVLSLRFSMKQDTLLCEVDDNGVGRAYTARFQTGQHVSLGMKITRERVDTINRMYDIDVQVVLHDKQDNAGIAQGTLVRLFIPFKKTNRPC